VIQKPEEQKGRWAQVFGNENPIHIEIGMGKGKFITTLAKQNPEINYIGIERYSSVLLRAVERLQKEEEQVPNLFFICIDAAEIADYFAEDEVDKIYLNFSDPWPKARHAKRRLTSRVFFERYTHVLKMGEYVEFKTDNHDLFEFSLDELREIADWELIAYTYDLHHEPEMNEGNVMTEYEEKFSGMGNPIHKLVAKRIG
jgi:tRNA (guanine-N7-)-methyltransferase